MSAIREKHGPGFQPSIHDNACPWGCAPGWDGLGLWPIFGAAMSMLPYCVGPRGARRAALISAAVTGKIDVRGLAA
jgi:hypothetical protein